jgi:hypothetical protein
MEVVVSGKGWGKGWVGMTFKVVVVDKVGYGVKGSGILYFDVCKFLFVIAWEDEEMYECVQGLS